MTAQALPILHHFEASPFSEKIRVVFGFKNLAWQSCLIPRIMPKPDLMPLTGGYRRTPVMQIGADIYCDTQEILRALERHAPTPPALPNLLRGAPFMVAQWTDRAMFETCVKLVFGSLGDKVPQAFIDDRTKLRGAPFDVAAMAAGLPRHRAQYRAHVALIERQLAHGHDFLFDSFTAADAHAYMNVWYVRSNLPEQADGLLDMFPHVRAWEMRVRALGHGDRTDISGADALRVATSASPSSARGEIDPIFGLRAGDRVVVSADEPLPIPIEGELAVLDAATIAIRRSDPRTGEVTVHFPRIGYDVRGI